MNFKEYEETIKDKPYTETLEYSQAIMWLHPELLPLGVVSIGEGTFAGCDNLEDVYFEGSMEEWRKINIVHDKHEIEFGKLISGTPVHEIKAERLLHVPGNDALLTANIHFHCALSDLECDSRFELTMGGKDITDFFRTM